MKKLKVNVVSESQYGWRAQGVYAVFQTTIRMLEATGEVDVRVNSFARCDILHAHFPGPLYFALAPFYAGRRVMSAHVVPESFHQSTTGWRQLDPLISRYIVHSFNTANLLIAVSPAVRANLRSRGVRTPQIVIPNPIDLSQFRPDPVLRARGRAMLGIGPREKVVIGVGLICLRKGFDEFLEVARRNPALTFVWVGGSSFSILTDGYFKKQEWIAAAPKNARFPGLLPIERMPDAYNAADLFFLPTRQDNHPMSVAEAAACGVPIVLRDIPDFREIFGSAYLAAAGVEGFSDCIRKAMGDPALSASLRRDSLAMIRRYDAPVIAARLLEAYRQLRRRSRERASRAS